MQQQLNSAFGFLIFLQFFFSTSILCTTGYYLTKVSISGAYFWFVMMMMTVFVLEIYMYCLFGEEITSKVNYPTSLFVKRNNVSPIRDD